MKKIRIAQLGIGHNHASAKMNALRSLTDCFEVVGVSEENPFWKEKRQSLECYNDIPFLPEDELLDTPGLEAVAIETDGPELLPTACKCAARGLHLHMDKPAGQDLNTFKMLCDTCRQKHLAFQLAYVYRYNPALRFMVEAVRKGWLGNIFEIHAVMSRYDGNNDFYRKWLAQYKGGAMYIFAGYLLDFVIQLLGEPLRIHAFLKQTRHDGLVDNGLAVLEYDIATATARVSVEEVDGMRHRRIIVCGTKGSLELCPIEPPGNAYFTEPLHVRLTLKDGNETYTPGTHDVDCGCLNDRYDRQLIEFARIVRGEIANPFPLEHEYLLHKTLLQVCGALPELT